MTTVDTGTTATVADRGWRWRHSLWLLAPILGCGYLSFIGYAYCAVRVRQRKWTVLAVCSFALTIIGWILVSAWTDSEGNPTTAAVVYMVGLWLVSIIFGLIVNRDYLEWRASVYGAAGARPTAPAARPGAVPTAPGWYDDPSRGDQIRWWDGTAWTTYVGPRPR